MLTSALRMSLPSISTKQKLCLIVALDKNNGFSANQQIPWKITEDFNFFSDITKRKSRGTNAVIMGKNTWKTLPDISRGLKDRINIIISSTMTKEEMDADNVTQQQVHLYVSLEEALTSCANTETIGDVYICGGKGIYEEAIQKYDLDEIFITKIDHDFNTDTFFDPYPYLTSDRYVRDKCHKFKLTDNISGASFITSFSKYVGVDKLSVTSTNTDEELYLHMVERILTNGHFRQTRNACTWSSFGKTLDFDLSNGFPLLTTKKMFFRGICEELFFFLRGDTNATHLLEKGVKIWEPNTNRQFLDKVGLSSYMEGDMGPMYGYNWRHYGADYKTCTDSYEGQGIDQIAECLNLLKKDPFSRRIIMTTYNPSVAHQGVLYPCHGLVVMWGVEVSDTGSYLLSCMMTQRSADSICGIPFNIASYGLLVHLFCEVLNNDVSYTGPRFEPGRLVINFGDVHIYESHRTQAIRQILREPYPFPKLSFNRQLTSLTDITYEDIKLTDYVNHPGILVKMVA